MTLTLSSGSNRHRPYKGLEFDDEKTSVSLLYSQKLRQILAT